MPAEKFKLPGSSYGELAKIIQAYAKFSDPQPTTEIAKIAVVHNTIISKNNGFLVELGLIEAGKSKVATERGRALGRALEHQVPEDIRRYWREAVEATDFLTKLIAAVRIRNGMDQSTLQAHIAYSAGQPKRPATLTGASTIIEVLRTADLLHEQDGKLVVAQGKASYVGTAPVQQDAAVAPQPQIRATPIEFLSAAVETSVSVRLDVQVVCKPDDLEGLGARIRAVLDEIRGSETNEVETGD